MHHIRPELKPEALRWQPMSASEDHFHDHGHSQDGHGTVDVEAYASASRRKRSRRANRALITDATFSPEQNRRSRESRYLLLQGIRLPFIALSMLAAFAWHNWWLAAVFFVISIPLPWISVMVANGQGEVRDARSKNVYKPALAREEMRLEEARRAQLGAADQAAAPTIIDHEER